MTKPDWQRALAKYVDDRNAAIETINNLVESIEAAKKLAIERLKRQERSQRTAWRKFEDLLPEEYEQFDPLHVADELDTFDVGPDELDRYLEDPDGYSLPKPANAHNVITIMDETMRTLPAGRTTMTMTMTTRCVFQKGDIVEGMGVFAPWGPGQVKRVAPRETLNVTSGETTTYPDEPRVWVHWEFTPRGALSMSPEHLRLVARPGSSAD